MFLGFRISSDHKITFCFHKAKIFYLSFHENLISQVIQCNMSNAVFLLQLFMSC